MNDKHAIFHNNTHAGFPLIVFGRIKDIYSS
jgi:hypothetical protein